MWIWLLAQELLQLQISRSWKDHRKNHKGLAMVLPWTFAAGTTRDRIWGKMHLWSEPFQSLQNMTFDRFTLSKRLWFRAARCRPVSKAVSSHLRDWARTSGQEFGISSKLQPQEVPQKSVLIKGIFYGRKPWETNVAIFGTDLWLPKLAML